MVGFVDTPDNQRNFDQKFAGKDAGPYIGTVKFVDDPTRQGRLGVNIPDISQTDNPTREQVIWCQYLSPFYGAKSIRAVSKSDANDYKTTQHSYGFWAVPPDIDTEVLVIFAKGEANRRNAFWIGCVQQPLTNQQVPGYGASRNTERARQDARELAQTGQTNFGTDFLPVGEKNRKMIEEAQTETFANSIKYPVNDILAEQLVEQGLIADDIRGTTSSSARRETPSQVFGISTPGRIRPDTRTLPIGVGATPVATDRSPGHSLVLDDGDATGNNQLTRIRTASGHQLLMHDTHGVVYIANGSGNSWIEMNSDGQVMIYAQDGFNLRSDGNFELHSGGDINFHAKHSIKFTAESEIVNNANFLMNLGKNGIFNTSEEGAIMSYAKSGISSYTKAQQLHGAGGQIHLAGKQVHFNSTSASESWGPTWLNPQSAGIVYDESQNDVNLTVGTGQVLKANTKKTLTTVSNLVTHEPFTRAPSGIYETVSQWENPKEWKRLSETPGTLEYLAQENRKSPVEYIRNLQFLTDQKKYLSSQGVIDIKGLDRFNPNEMKNLKLNLNTTKLKSLSDQFTKSYNSIYKVKSVVENLKTTDIKQVLTSKVVAGRITSVASSLAGKFLGTSSANNLPPSLRGTATGRITQVATALKQKFSKAATAIGSFFKGFRF